MSALGLIAAAVLTGKDPSAALLQTGLGCAEQLNYGCALQNLEAFRDAQRRTPSIPPGDAIKGCSALATVYASVDRAADAESTFEWCLEIDPRYAVDADVVGPRIYPRFKAARARFLEKRLELAPLGPGVPPLHEAPLRIEPVLHTPSEVLLSGKLAIGGADAPNRLSMSAGGTLLFDQDAESYSPGFALEVDYLRRLGAVTLVIDVDFSSHATKRDDIRSGYPSTLYTVGVAVGVDWAWLAADRLEIIVGAVAGLSMAGVGSVDDRAGGQIGLRAGLMVRIADEFAAGFLVEPGLIVAPLESGDLGLTTVMPLLARFEARF